MIQYDDFECFWEFLEILTFFDFFLYVPPWALPAAAQVSQRTTPGLRHSGKTFRSDPGDSQKAFQARSDEIWRNFLITSETSILMISGRILGFETERFRGEWRPSGLRKAQKTIGEPQM